MGLKKQMDEQYRIAERIRNDKISLEGERNEAVKEIEKLHQLIEEMDQTLQLEQTRARDL